jgi:threonine dehydrogenase-like Zn-dependent dehydrogenase
VLRVSQAVICGSDLHMYRGDATSPLPANERAMGHEGIGVIHKLSPGVTADAFVFSRHVCRPSLCPPRMPVSKVPKVPDDFADEMVGSVGSYR